MRGVRAFSSSARQARQALFEIKHTKPSEEDKAHAKSRKRLSRQINPFIARDAKVIRSVFYCGYASRQKLSEFGRRITTALAKLQDPNSFRVQDITFSQLSALPTISYPPSLTIIDLCNPLGVPPDTPKPAIPPIHDPSLVAQALSEAGLTGSFAQVDRLRRRDSPDALGYSVSRPWPHYRHVTRGGFIHPPRLNIDADDSDLGRFTLTLPGSTIPAFYDFLANFHERNPEFRQVVAVVALWARSHDLQLNAETVALMVMASMQGEAPLFGEGEKRGYANVEHKVSDRWHQTIAPVQIDHLKDVPRLDRGSVEGYIFGFFRHWTNAANSFYNSAFTVRKGRMKQRIPREYISDNPQFTGGYAFSINQIDDLTEDFPPWRHELLVIQDPFLFTHNHAAHLSFNEVEELIHQLEQTYELMHAGSPLAAMFGPHAAPPDSAAEAKILEDPLVYAPAIGLLRADRIPHTSQPEQPEQLSPRPLPPRPIPQNDFDPRLRRAPWTRRAFHSSCVSLGGGKRTIQPTSPKPVLRREKTERVLPSHKGQEGVRSVARSTRTPTPPRPVARWEKQEEPDEDQAGVRFGMVYATCRLIFSSGDSMTRLSANRPSGAPG
ncbi:hypothetical protein B0H17DRAFT_665381 [Mycena rosella]|uniref:Uncharacterized protein n=1 Tax=Mycena rosella TaxID=1033263 RepID=A0AAD7GU59_MYCRO|nr:hypothetical protein B0H17DRAFT_665381 [Mycena rosella]